MAIPSWTGPLVGSKAFRQLNVGTDCDLFADFAMTALTVDWTSGGDAFPIIKYLRTILPTSESPIPTPLDLLRWFEDLHLVEGINLASRALNETFLKQVDASNPVCVPKACYKLLRNIEMDSDLAGIGVLFSIDMRDLPSTTDKAPEHNIIHYRCQPCNHIRRGSQPVTMPSRKICIAAQSHNKCNPWFGIGAVPRCLYHMSSHSDRCNS